MKSILIITVLMLFFVNANAAVSIGNPCNVGECTNPRAEEIINSIYAYADQIRSLSQYIDENGVDKPEALTLVVKAKELNVEAYKIYRNFSSLLNISDNSERISVSKRYSSYQWRSYVSVQNEVYRLSNKVRFMKVTSK